MLCFQPNMPARSVKRRSRPGFRFPATSKSIPAWGASVLRCAAALKRRWPQWPPVMPCPGLSVTGVFQHFAAADSEDDGDIAYTEEQHALFARTLDALRAAAATPAPCTARTAPAQLCHPEWRGSMTRAGIVLYGLDPSEDLHFPALRPVMALKARIAQVKTLLPGQSVCYGRTFTAETPRRVATVTVGYADGYPRLCSGSQGGGVMLIHGRPAPVLGRVCMDQTVVDVTDIPGAAMGDEVTVFGAEATAGGDTARRSPAKPVPFRMKLSAAYPAAFPASIGRAAPWWGCGMDWKDKFFELGV